MAEVLHFPSSKISDARPSAPAPTTASSAREAGAPSDAPARAAALDTRASWIVEAPAGSGKTGLLMQRFLKLLADDAVEQPEEVLAITFTRKATAELRNRVLTELEGAARNNPLKDPNAEFDLATRSFAEAVLTRDRALAWNLLSTPQRLRIRTIDSVCAEIASALPLLSGSGGARRPVEDAEPLYRLAAHRTMLELGGSRADLDAALRTVLLHRDGSLGDCERLLARMLAQREQWAELLPLEWLSTERMALDDKALDREVRPKLERSLETIVCAGLTRALAVVPAPLLRDLTRLAQRLSLEPSYDVDKASPVAFCSDKSESPEARVEHLDHWLTLTCLVQTKEGTWRQGFASNHLGFKLPKHEKIELQTLIAKLSAEPMRKAFCDVRCLPPTRYPDDQWHVAKALFRLLLHALAELKMLFAERGECDFAEFALAARQALSAEDGAADLAAASGASLRHLLVDEMQDTSSSQYELIELLTRSWDGHSQTLFLVGDPKQSIYLFRQARVERFLRTIRKGRLGEVPVRPLKLTANFRSQATLVENFNQDFSCMFPIESDASPTESVDVPFVAATPVRTAGSSPGIRWHAGILEDGIAPGGGGEKESAEADNARSEAARIHTLKDAADIRKTVEEWQHTPLPAGRTDPWRIAVLVRARSHLSSIVAEFKQADGSRRPIPFRAVKVEALAERPEVLDALALTRAVLHPADRVAWLAVLHAPWCGLGLADLLALTSERGTERMIVPQLVEAYAPNLSATGRTLLDRAWPTLLAALVQAGRGELATVVERTWRSLGGDLALSTEQRTNVHHFLALLRELTQSGGWVDLKDLEQRLQKLYAEPASTAGVVDLMTIHSAKGLEWDVVLVPALERTSRVSTGQLLNWLELDSAGGAEASIVLAPIAAKGTEQDKLYKWLNQVRKDREEAERKRLYYVACTRAREELHLFGAVRRKTDGTLAPPKGTLLESCWPAAERRFEAAALRAAGTLENQLSGSLRAEDLTDGFEDDPFANPPVELAASAAVTRTPPMLRRLPLAIDPLARFEAAAADRLPYVAASPQLQADPPERPEGSFAVRAFGNVVHRFLEWLSIRLAAGTSSDALLIELPTWGPRLEAGLRAEGLSPAQCPREASRALEALGKTLADETGQWLLAPRTAAASEQTLVFADARTLRVDRTFLADNSPGSSGDSCIWIVDFKTTQQGSRNADVFEREEREKYTEQLEGYAAIRRSLPDGAKPVYLALYYPLVPRLIYWESQGSLA